MFGIVIPMWNSRNTILRAVNSVLSQTSEYFELIIVDDGSTDGAAELLHSIADGRIRLIRQDNSGPGPARNRGIEASKGPWVAFLDSDDLWLPGHLSELDSVRTAFPDAGVIGTSYVRADAFGRYDLPDSEQNIIERVDYILELGRRRHVLHSSSVAINKDVCRQCGWFGPSRLGEDSEFWIRLALNVPVAASRRVTAIYHHSPNGLIATNRHRWRTLASTRDLSPAIGALLDAYPRLSAAQRAAVDATIDRYAGWCVSTSADIEDVQTLRRLTQIYRSKPPLREHVLLRLAALPMPIAKLLLGWRSGIKTLLGRG